MKIYCTLQTCTGFEHSAHDEVVRIQQIVHNKHNTTVIEQECQQCLFRRVSVVNLELKGALALWS